MSVVWTWFNCHVLNIHQDSPAKVGQNYMTRCVKCKRLGETIVQATN